MSTRTEFEYLTPTTFGISETFTFEEPDAPANNAEGAEGEASRNDIGYFMDIARRYPLLGSEEERALGLALWMERCRLLRLLRRSPLEPRLGLRAATPSTRRRLARVELLARRIAAKQERRKGVSRRHLSRSLAEIERTRSRMVEANLRLVVWVAKRFRGRGFDFVDLIQEGSLGLMRAVDRFDPRVGARFSTFATHWIQQGIRRALAERARTIRVPVNRIPEVRRIHFAQSRLGRAATAGEIASGCGLSRKKVEELLPAIAPIESIDGPVPPTDKPLSDVLADRTRPSPLDQAMEAETRSAVKAGLRELPRRQRIILSMRHGIDYPRECTLDEIGDALGLSRERIRQVEKAAVASVRQWIEEHRSELARPV
jgi:RNA polymerase sigma factor (sigma-70 family)